MKSDLTALGGLAVWHALSASVCRTRVLRLDRRRAKALGLAHPTAAETDRYHFRRVELMNELRVHDDAVALLTRIQAQKAF